jgi:hypothetical protein
VRSAVLQSRSFNLKTKGGSGWLPPFFLPVFCSFGFQKKIAPTLEAPITSA